MAKRIASPQDLKALQEKAKADIDLRAGPKDVRVTIHMGTCGIAAGARDVLSQLAGELVKVSLENVTLQQSGCIGLCDQEPMMTVTDKGGAQYRYGKLDKTKVREIVQAHLLGGKPVAAYLVKA